MPSHVQSCSHLIIFDRPLVSSVHYPSHPFSLPSLLHPSSIRLSLHLPPCPLAAIFRLCWPFTCQLQSGRGHKSLICTIPASRHTSIHPLPTHSLSCFVSLISPFLLSSFTLSLLCFCPPSIQTLRAAGEVLRLKSIAAIRADNLWNGQTCHMGSYLA